jgi:hypothetical protein
MSTSKQHAQAERARAIAEALQASGALSSRRALRAANNGCRASRCSQRLWRLI